MPDPAFEPGAATQETATSAAVVRDTAKTLTALSSALGELVGKFRV